uniref:Aldehyde dehydrogenase domain-containing protein n=1 Tax=Ciona savignyi TaxID=51511 RepID=H2Y864_CIOSA
NVAKPHRNLIRLLSSGNYEVTTPLNFINGARVDSIDPVELIDVIEPATGKVICQMPESGTSDVNEAIKSSRQAQVAWADLSGFERGKLLSKSALLLKQKQEEIARIEVYDTGKPIQEARMDVQTAIDALEYYGGIASTICGQHFNLSNGSFGYTRREPLGVVAAIGAWNYPIQIAAWKAAPALAGGNSVVCKPSQFTPLSAVSLAEVFTEAGFPLGLFNVVQGGAVTGNTLTGHKGVAKVTFTGSVETGSKVMGSCARDIRHVTLELGGKSPLILFNDCDITNAINGALNANFFSQGQVCSNGTRVFIHKDIYEEVVGNLVQRTQAIKHGDPHHEQTKMGAMINPQHADKVMGFIERARQEGAEILCGGELVKMEDPVLHGGSYISPCIISEYCFDEMEISREETFGPVMNVYSFQSEEEVVRRANHSKYGLASGVFTNDLKRAHRVAAKMEAGSCYVNNYNIFPMEMPFGGFKQSGLGRENGTVTMDYFTQLKTVYFEMNDVDSPF